EVAAHGMAVGGGHGHLADAVDERHAHGNEGGAVAIVQVQEVEGGALALFDLQTQAGVEGFLAWPADPEVALTGLAHLDHPLFHAPGSGHEAVDIQAARGGQGFLTAAKLGNEECDPLAPGRALIRHATSSSEYKEEAGRRKDESAAPEMFRGGPPCLARG